MWGGYQGRMRFALHLAFLSLIHFPSAFGEPKPHDGTAGNRARIAECQEILEGIKARCNVEPNSKQDKYFLQNISEKFLSNHCEEEKWTGDDQALSEILIWERAVQLGTHRSDDRTNFRMFIEQIRDRVRMVMPPPRKGQGWVKLDEIFHWMLDVLVESAWAAPVESAGGRRFTFKEGSPEDIVAKEILHALESNKPFQLSDQGLRAFLEIRTLFTLPIYPLENMCASLSKRNARYDRDPKNDLANLLLAIHLLKAWENTPIPIANHSDVDHLFTPDSLGNLKAVASYLFTHDSNRAAILDSARLVHKTHFGRRTLSKTNNQREVAGRNRSGSASIPLRNHFIQIALHVGR